MADYATIANIESAWRELTSDEMERAAKLITYASARMRVWVPDLDQKIADGTIETAIAEQVCVAIVKRAMQSGTAGDGVTSARDSVGQVSTERTYGNPLGNLYMASDEYYLLGVKPPGNRGTSTRTRYIDPVLCGEPWGW